MIELTILTPPVTASEKLSEAKIYYGHGVVALWSNQSTCNSFFNGFQFVYKLHILAKCYLYDIRGGKK